VAQSLRHLGLDASSACPDRALIRSELVPLLRGYELSEHNEAAPDFVARVEDLGESYTVSIGDASRTVTDPRRQCLERARVVAVFVALNLPPPETSTPATSAVARVAHPPPQVVGAPRASTMALDLRPFVQAEAATGAGVASSGIGVGASMRLRGTAVTLLGGATTSTTPYQPAGQPPSFELHRVPFALLLGRQAGLGMLDLGVEAGAALDVLRFRGQAVPNPSAAWRVNPGVRVNAVLRARASGRLAAEVMPTLSWFPRTYVVGVEPGRVLAETPRWWLGVSLGLSCEVWGS
jgi:hypothetical protein